MLCLLAATVFWFFNALNKTYTTQLTFPVEFQYDQDNFMPVSDLPTQVKMNVTGMGWTLLRRSAGVKVPALLFPLERPTEVKKVIGSTLPVLFASQLGDLQINFVATDTLRLDIEPIDGRWLTLTHADLTSNFKKGFGLASNVTVTPDSVFVQGPRRMVEAMPEPYPIQLTTGGIDEPVEAQVMVLSSDVPLSVEPAQVQVSFRVEELVEFRDSVKLEITNIPNRLRPVIDLREIHYTLQLPVSVWHSTYSRNAVRAILDLKKNNGSKSKMAPQITGIPPLARIVRVDTVQVSY